MDHYDRIAQSCTERLCEFAEELAFTDLPAGTIEQTKKTIADYYAASIAGYRINRTFNHAIIEMVKDMAGSEQSFILFELKKRPAAYAAFTNAIFAHGADMDDGNRNSAGHISAHVLSAVFAVADKFPCCWKDVIVSINVGYEFFNRIVAAGQPGLYNKGFHSTGVGGGMASAAACAKLMHLDKKGIYNSVSLASIQSSGLIIIDESGQSCKPINPANAARIGVEASFLGAKGIQSPRRPLESKKGWFNAFCNFVDIDKISDGLGETFTIEESYLKLYPTCRHTHSCIDAALEIMKKIEILKQFDQKEKNRLFSIIKSMDIYVCPNAIRSAGHIVHPQNADEAKFSIQYTVAVACVKRSFCLDDLEHVGENDDINKMAECINLIPAPEMENRTLGLRGAKIVAALIDGTEIESYVPLPKGEGKQLLKWDDILKKMHTCCENVFDVETAERINSLCRDIDPDYKYNSITENITKMFFKKRP